MKGERTIGASLLLLVSLATSCRQAPSPSDSARLGGRLVVALASGPKTFNPLFADDQESLSVLGCLMAGLVRINRQTGEPELELAESLTYSPDRTQMTIRLRRGLTFSDGHPLTAEDVLFTFEVLYDPGLPNALADLLRIGGRRLEVRRQDELTLIFTLPYAYAPVERLLDAVYILPKHRLELLYRRGAFASAWGLSTPAAEIVGAGPFRLKEYVPGQRTVLVRNPHYWKRDAQGNPLPYLEEITFLIVPDRNTRLLRFQQGELDMLAPLSPEEAARVQPQVEAGTLRLFDLGPSLISEVLWFNLNPHAPIDPLRRSWFQDVRFRQAISLAIDRQALVEVVFSGRATPVWGPVPPSSPWYNPKIRTYPYDPSGARALLSEMGLADRNGDGLLEDPQGRPVTFTVVTTAANPLRERIGLMIQEDLRKVGLRVQIVPLEAKSLLARIERTFDYEAGLLGLALGDTDPSALNNILPSWGTSHWWNPRQKRPSTEWEQRIDALMNEQMRTFDPLRRKALFDEVQQIMSEQVPFIYLVARDLIVAAKATIGNLKPGLLPDFLLWNAEQLYVRPIPTTHPGPSGTSPRERTALK